jgi:hypothetical protein
LFTHIRLPKIYILIIFQKSKRDFIPIALHTFISSVIECIVYTKKLLYLGRGNKFMSENNKSLGFWGVVGAVLVALTIFALCG